MTGRILVVDDLIPNIKLLEAKLTNEYYDVVTAKSGIEALEILKTTPIDVVLLDVMMPGMDGFETCRRIKSDPELAPIPVIMVTALTETADRLAGLKAGADDFVTKPINDTALFARLRSVLRLKVIIDQLRLHNESGSKLDGLSAKEFELITHPQNAKIFVIDDDGLQTRMVSDTFTPLGFMVKIVADPAQAIPSLLSSEADLIIVSLHLEEADGLRLCSQIRNNQDLRFVPIMIIADDDDTQQVLKGLELGINDYIVAPIDAHEMIARAHTMIKRKRYQDALRDNLKDNMQKAVTDGLTGLFNRRYLDVHSEVLFHDEINAHHSMAVMMVDVDHFKSVNDTYGHQAGDEILKEIAKRLTLSTRVTDFVARYGGEEFVIVLPSTAVKDAVKVAERLLHCVSSKPCTISVHPGSLSVTVSIGLASNIQSDSSSVDIIKHADQALYQAKRNGRNRTEIYQPDAGMAAQKQREETTTVGTPAP
jgi:two-component system cell cycle response regulator